MPANHALDGEPPGSEPVEAPTIRLNRLSALRDVPFHLDAPGITRRSPEAFPIHVAIHEIQGCSDPMPSYTTPHRHPVAELNLLIAPPGELVYRVTLDGEDREVTSPASIWIPPGVLHAANVVRGRGTFVCVLLASSRDAFPDAND